MPIHKSQKEPQTLGPQESQTLGPQDQSPAHPPVDQAQAKQQPHLFASSRCRERPPPQSPRLHTHGQLAAAAAALRALLLPALQAGPSAAPTCSARSHTHTTHPLGADTSALAGVPKWPCAHAQCAQACKQQAASLPCLLHPCHVCCIPAVSAGGPIGSTHLWRAASKHSMQGSMLSADAQRAQHWRTASERIMHEHLPGTTGMKDITGM